MKGIHRIRRLYARTKTQLGIRGSGAVILVYHRIDDLPDDPLSLAVRPGNFIRHMHHVREQYEPIRLWELVGGLSGGSLPERGLVVTFDDGYLDNFTQALPVLEAYGIPASMFITSGSLKLSQGFWWDELARIFRSASKLPATLQLSVNGRNYCWPTDSSSQCDAAWKSLHALLMPLSHKERDLLLEKLAQSDLIDVGAHTVTHPPLPALSEAEQRREIAGSRSHLEAIVGRPVELLAYPYGRCDRRISQITAACGFRAACAGGSAKVNQGSDLFRLPRFTVQDWKPEQFSRQLSFYFNT